MTDDLTSRFSAVEIEGVIRSGFTPGVLAATGKAQVWGEDLPPEVRQSLTGPGDEDGGPELAAVLPPKKRRALKAIDGEAGRQEEDASPATATKASPPAVPKSPATAKVPPAEDGDSKPKGGGDDPPPKRSHLRLVR